MVSCNVINSTNGHIQASVSVVSRSDIIAYCSLHVVKASSSSRRLLHERTPMQVLVGRICFIRTFSDDAEFAQWPWTAAVISNTHPSSCGIVGQFSTPTDLRTEDCYNVNIGCEDRSAMKITASHCSTDTVFDCWYFYQNY
ncbi:hypothetical protein ANCCAN_14555 [Ancylostoma caninum]|uniref:DUF7045 domain-containing protein n=1 Tax=Ancylostoma caninum TaxID=29170 RepID=A0A368G9V1_ANCCA|nr:hypothetical protein ANCCAN_14555 [Ancylostoma caninum]